MRLLSIASFFKMFEEPNILIGVILAGLGFSTVLLARRITMAVRKTDKVENNDHVYLGLLGFALVMILAGLLITIIR